MKSAQGQQRDYLEGLLGESGDVDDARDALGVGSAISFRNRLINATFAINQRGVAGTVTLSAGAYGHDRWKAGSGGCTYTFATSAGVTTLTITSGTLVQVVEAGNIAAGDYTLSWQGTAQARVNNTGAYANSPITDALSGGVSAYVEFNSGTLVLPQLEFGGAVTPSERRHLGLELALCQRYYERVTTYGITAGGVAGTSLALGCQYKVSKRTTPSINGSVTYTNASGMALSSIGIDSFVMGAVVTGTGVAALVYSNVTIDAEL
ncbi:MAG: hypothetical protein V4757_07075 [Pseudomonadota bacterium]